MSLLFLLCLFVPLPFCVTSSFFAQTTQPQISIRWVPQEGGKMAVELAGLNAVALRPMARWTPQQFQRVLSVYAGATDAGLPPMLGKYRIEANALRFEPQFALEPGVTYRAVFQPGQVPGNSAAGNSVTIATFTPRPRDLTPSTLVAQIYPSADELPENLLKFYIHFSAPMRRGNIYDHIHLLDAMGKAIELPFLEIDEELWNQDFTRLTLFIDPGRIKRGVKPLEEIGPSLEAGKTYRLVIDREWRDSNGAPLKTSFEKSFRVTPPDRQAPDPAQWNIATPAANSREALTISFPEPMEHALAQRMIVVATESGEPIQGTVSLENQERQWKFVPATAWRRGRHNLIIQTTIEDLAGNNIGKLFDVDVFNSVQRQLTSQTVKLSFDIR